MDSYTLDFSLSPGHFYQALEFFGCIPFPALRLYISNVSQYSSHILQLSNPVSLLWRIQVSLYFCLKHVKFIILARSCHISKTLVYIHFLPYICSKIIISSYYQRSKRIGKDSWQIIQQFIIHFTSYHKNILHSKATFHQKQSFLLKFFRKNNITITVIVSQVYTCQTCHCTVYICAFYCISIYTLVKMLKGEGYGNPLQYSCLENPVERGA